MRKIVVCEDGEREAEKIQKILQDDQGIFEEEIEIFLYTTGKKLIDDCKSGKLTPDLVFMDIELPDMTGIEVAKEINYLVPYCYIVYVTNHVDYFTDVYSTEHQYYVLKKELKEHFPQIKEKIWRMEQEHNDTIIIPIKNKQQKMLHKESIRYMERKGRKTYIHVVDDDIVETYKLVTTVRSNSLKNLISRESPLGAAIFGHKVGDRCEVKVNDSYSYFVEIRRIENTVDDGSDELRKF